MAEALTIKQPWAWAIIEAGKDVENRKQRTRHRGPLFIHAGLQDSLEGWEWLDEMDIPLPVDPPNGGVVGLVDLVDCAQGYDSRWAMEGHYHWVFDNPESLPFVPMKGDLFMFDPLARASSKREASWLEEAIRARTSC